MLYVHRSERADRLAQELGRILGTPLDDPFARELVAVPTRGMERWLTQRLSGSLGARSGHADGVAAAIEFPFPGRLVAEVLASAAGIDPETDPWVPERLVWPLMAVTEAALEEQWLAPLAVHLRAPAGERRFSRLQQLARLFSRYASYRPRLVLEWLQGSDRGAERARWQPELLRRLAAAIAVPNPAQRLAPVRERLLDDPMLVSLPQRLSVFGPTRLPQDQLEVLQALGAGRDVHLMVLHPSPALWDGAGARNRLLASWGRESAAIARILRSERGEHHEPAAPTPATLLTRIQHDIRGDHPQPGPPLPGAAESRPPLQNGDQSIRVHACHGRARQVEVMREAILHRLQQDPTLELRDIIVMCPSVEEFAPLIEAAFDGGELPVRIADRSLRRTNPLLAVLGRLLEFPAGRVTASEVLDLADSQPVRRRFGFRDEDLSQLRQWVVDGSIHWGLSARARAPFKLTEIDAGTWAAGLRRLMLSVALTPDAGLYQGVLAATEVDSGTIALAGRAAEFAGRLQSAVTSLGGPQPVSRWAQALSAAADALTAHSSDEGWQRQELDALVDDLLAGAGQAHTPLSLAEMRALLGDRLRGRPTRANFRTGHLTVCTLAPMRSVPHRVVCLLGLDDGLFPRAGRRDGDDLLLADPRPGDRDPRAEDRQLLLDALLAAGEALIITYSGNDERTNAPRPPAVPVGELLDTIDATVDVSAIEGTSRPGRARDLVLIHHPLQSFDPRNFLAGGHSLAGDGRAWSFDAVELQGALALGRERTSPQPFLPAPLPDGGRALILALDDLVRFAERPVRAFLRQRLELSIGGVEDEVSDSLPVELDPLARWNVGQHLLEALGNGVSGRDACLAEVARGTLPPGSMARAVLADVYPSAERIARAAAAFAGGGQPRSLESNVLLADATRVTGTVSGVRGQILLSVSYSRLNPRHRIAAWVRLLALTAAHPEIAFEAVTVARARRGRNEVEVARVPALGGDRAARGATARAELEALVSLHREGMRAPLPLPPESAHAYAQAKLGGADPQAAALEAWNDRFARAGGRIEGERSRDENPVVIGPELDLARLDELAPRLWGPLLMRERVERA